VSPPIASRLLLGGLAGVVGTAAMTAAMSRLHRALPANERYPLPPREVVISAGLKRSDAGLPVEDATLAAHFGFGAVMGAILALFRPRLGLSDGAAAGAAIWAGSYLGAFPVAGVLSSAARHPLRRNALMIGVHLVWGAVTAVTLRELRLSRVTMLAPGPLKDRAPFPRL
jgi:uncharacterized membrane protein YagU involved in acid resistance